MYVSLFLSPGLMWPNLEKTNDNHNNHNNDHTNENDDDNNKSNHNTNKTKLSENIFLAPFCCEPVFCCRPVNVESTSQNLTARLVPLVPKPSPALHDRQGRVQPKGKTLSQETPREGEVGRGQGWPKGASGSALCMIHVRALPSCSVLLRTGVLLSPCECNPPIKT